MILRTLWRVYGGVAMAISGIAVTRELMQLGAGWPLLIMAGCTSLVAAVAALRG
jgi:hypothetical protein